MLSIDRFWQPLNILPVPKPVEIVDFGAAYLQCFEVVLTENHWLFLRMCLINCSCYLLEHDVRLFGKKADLDLRVLTRLIFRKIMRRSWCLVTQNVIDSAHA